MLSITRRWRIVTIGASIALTAALFAAPVAADDHTDTPTTFTITEGDGNLHITVPDDAPLGNVQFGGDLNAPLGQVQVTDNRSNLIKAWEVHVEATDFVASDVAGADEDVVVPAEELTYEVGLDDISGNLTGGTMAATPTTLDGGTAVTFTTVDLGLFVLTGSASWTPNITFDAGTTPPGTYSGTVTHSLLP